MNADRKRPSGQGWASMGIAGLAVAVVVAGLAIGGGPLQARKERHDDTRRSDLSQLSDHINCLARRGDEFVMPSDLKVTSECPAEPPRKDPYTDNPYRFETLEDGHYRLCADFELPAEKTSRWDRSYTQRDGQCIVYSIGSPFPVSTVPAAAPEAPTTAETAPADDGGSGEAEPAESETPEAEPADTEPAATRVQPAPDSATEAAPAN